MPSLPLYEGVDWNTAMHVVQLCVLSSPSLRGSGLKCRVEWLTCWPIGSLPLYEGVDWNSAVTGALKVSTASPSLRGSGLKCCFCTKNFIMRFVSLFTREWIEIASLHPRLTSVQVSLFTREWIEIGMRYTAVLPDVRLPLYEGVDWNRVPQDISGVSTPVSLFTREWIEIECRWDGQSTALRLPLYEGVDWNMLITSFV